MSQDNIEKLKNFWVSKKKSDPKYSLRRLAKEVGVSSGYLSEVFSRKKALTPQLLIRLARALEVDRFHLEELKTQALPELLKPKVSKAPAGKKKSTQTRTSKAVRKKWELKSDSGRILFSDWRYLAILELADREEAITIKDLQGRIDATTYYLQEAISRMVKAGLLISEGGGYRKPHSMYEIISGTSDQEIRQFHSRMLTKIQKDLNEKTSQKDFEKRLVSGFSLGIDSARVMEFIHRLDSLVTEFTEFASSSAPSDAYYFAIQFIPLTEQKQSAEE